MTRDWRAPTLLGETLVASLSIHPIFHCIGTDRTVELLPRGIYLFAPHDAAWEADFTSPWDIKSRTVLPAVYIYMYNSSYSRLGDAVTGGNLIMKTFFTRPRLRRDQFHYCIVRPCAIFLCNSDTCPTVEEQILALSTHT